jgi:hypothetical protein
MSAPAAWRNAAKLIGSFFSIEVIHTRYPKADVERMLPAVKRKVEDGVWAYAEQLERRLSSANLLSKQIRHELRLIRQANDNLLLENEGLRGKLEATSIELAALKSRRPKQKSWVESFLPIKPNRPPVHPLH